MAMKIKITDTHAKEYEIETKYDSIFEVLQRIDEAEYGYITFHEYDMASKSELVRAIKKEFIVSIEELKSTKITNLDENYRFTF